MPGVSCILGGLTTSLISDIPLSFAIEPALPLVVVGIASGVILIIVMRCVLSIRALPHIVANFVANETFSFLPHFGLAFPLDFDPELFLLLA